jgi:hypothetical protein
MTRNTASPILLCLLLATVTSQSLSREIKISGLGTRTCSEWTSWKDDKNGELRAMTLEWAQGFITGHNLYGRNGTTHASSVVANANVLIPLLDSYCQKNPTARILNGMIEITQSLGGLRATIAPKPSGQIPVPKRGARTEQES